ncbi:MAG: DUF362 domain-containing protein [Methanobacterium sp.]
MGKLSIITTYNSKADRNIDNLANLYDTIEGITKKIRKLQENRTLNLSHFYGNSILIKPNWVRHNIKETDSLCLTTHPNFILAVLDIILDNKPKEVIIADAPIQGCVWDKLLPKEFYEHIISKERETGIPIKVLDLRRKEFHGQELVDNKRDISNYVIFDLEENSYLESITSVKNKFRVTDYNPNRLAESHSNGKHQYCIAKEVFEADYIIALPKAKTHQKTGITNALKLLVGFNGDKDFLPHHRVGGTGFGGDCYPGKNYILRLSEYFLDQANKRIGKSGYREYKFLTKLFWKSIKKGEEYSLAAGWFGNDTTWRMAMDLNLIAKYGAKNGTLEDKPQRSITYICDGIIGGQGDGPLNPEPLPLGIIMLSDNPAEMDYALALLMDFEPEKIPLITNALEIFPKNDTVVINGEEYSWETLKDFSVKTIPPPGWRKVLGKI